MPPLPRSAARWGGGGRGAPSVADSIASFPRSSGARPRRRPEEGAWGGRWDRGTTAPARPRAPERRPGALQGHHGRPKAARSLARRGGAGHPLPRWAGTGGRPRDTSPEARRSVRRVGRPRSPPNPRGRGSSGRRAKSGRVPHPRPPHTARGRGGGARGPRTEREERPHSPGMSVPRLARLRPGPGERDVTTSIEPHGGGWGGKGVWEARPGRRDRGSPRAPLASPGHQPLFPSDFSLSLSPAALEERADGPLHGLGAGAHGAAHGGRVTEPSPPCPDAPGAGAPRGTRGDPVALPPPPSGAQRPEGSATARRDARERASQPRGGGGSRLADGSRAPGRVRERAPRQQAGPTRGQDTDPVTHAQSPTSGPSTPIWRHKTPRSAARMSVPVGGAHPPISAASSEARLGHRARARPHRGWNRGGGGAPPPNLRARGSTWSTPEPRFGRGTRTPRAPAPRRSLPPPGPPLPPRVGAREANVPPGEAPPTGRPSGGPAHAGRDRGHRGRKPRPEARERRASRPRGAPPLATRETARVAPAGRDTREHAETGRGPAPRAAARARGPLPF